MSSPIPRHTPIAIIGAGLAGLSCARTLVRDGHDVHLIEASDGVGGRVRTDEFEGFKLDRGFQILLTAYPELKAQFDLPALRLQRFTPGSLIRRGDEFELLADPWRNPAGAFRSLFASVGGLGDKLRVASLRNDVRGGELDAQLMSEDRSTLEELRAHGFSESFIDGFFRPFLGGVFLERELETSSRLFRYLFRLFSEGDATVPADGMEALPRQLSAELEGRITLNARVQRLSVGGITLDDGRQLRADQIVLATDGVAAAGLLGQPTVRYKETVTTYFDAPEPPIDEAMLVLNGDGVGPVNHLAVMSKVAPSYAPEGRHLISLNGVGPHARSPERFAQDALEQMRGWFGRQVEGWEPLRSYAIAAALPHQPAGTLDPSRGPELTADGILVCGDHRLHGSLQGALQSGREGAELLLNGSLATQP